MRTIEKMSPHQVLDDLRPITDVIDAKNALEPLRWFPLYTMTNRDCVEEWGKPFGGYFGSISFSILRGVDIVHERHNISQQIHPPFRNEDLRESH
jgi:hypothetical protein